MPLLEVVHDPARGADDDVYAAAQRAQLDAVALAAVDGEHADAGQLRGVPLEGLADLERELTRGREDQRLRCPLVEVELREDRQREGRGLAGAGLGESDDVTAGEERSGSSRPGSATGSRSRPRAPPRGLGDAVRGRRR